jgi:hypothetical protein
MPVCPYDKTHEHVCQKGSKMKSVMVFNFSTMKFEQATEAEGKDWLSLIDNLNSDCAAQHHMHLTGGESAANQTLSQPKVSSAPKQNPVPPTRK